MELIFTLSIVGVDIFKNKFGQILQSIYIRGGAGRAVEDNVSRSSVSQRSGAHTARLPSDEPSRRGSGHTMFMRFKNMFVTFYKKCLYSIKNVHIVSKIFCIISKVNLMCIQKIFNTYSRKAQKHVNHVGVFDKC